jgi:hypothetical protein
MENTNCCNKVQAPSITPTLAAGSVASPYYVLINISQRLCYKTCADNSPVFAPRFSVVNFVKVGTNQYIANCNVQGIISYVRCGGDCSCTMQQPLNANFTIPFQASATPTSVTITQSPTINVMAASGCQTCSKDFVSETPLSIVIA